MKEKDRCIGKDKMTIMKTIINTEEDELKVISCMLNLIWREYKNINKQFKNLTSISGLIIKCTVKESTIQSKTLTQIHQS